MIRKLGFKQNSQISWEIARNFSRTLRVTSSLDLFANPRLLNKVIRYWMSTHPFLQAKIAPIKEENYFVYGEQFVGGWVEDDSDLDNVKRLVLDETSLSKLSTLEKEAFFNDLSWLICESELAKQFDYYKGPLWRLVIIQMDSQDSNEYDLSLVMHHSISEGTNSHMILLQLLDLLEYYWTVGESGVQRPLQVHQPHLSVEELYYENVDTTKYNNDRLKNLPFVTKPCYMDPAKASKCPMRPYQWADVLSSDWILETRLDSKIPWIQLGQLIKVSETIFFKSRRWTLTQEDTERFVDQCKTNKCSVTAVLACLFAMSIKEIQKMSDCLSTGDHFVTRFPVALRQFKPTIETALDDNTDLSMGYLISLTYVPFTNCYSFKPNRSEPKDEFWNYCKQKSNELRQIKDSCEVFFPHVAREQTSLDCWANNAVSSMGNLPAKLSDKLSFSLRGAFKIKQAYTEISIDVKECHDVAAFFSYISTGNGRMNFSMEYNSYYLSHYIHEKFLELFFEKFCSLIPKR